MSFTVYRDIPEDFEARLAALPPRLRKRRLSMESLLGLDPAAPSAETEATKPVASLHTPQVEGGSIGNPAEENVKTVKIEATDDSTVTAEGVDILEAPYTSTPKNLRKAKSFQNLAAQKDQTPDAEEAEKTIGKKSGAGKLTRAKSAANLRGARKKGVAAIPTRRSARLQERQEKQVDDLIGQAVVAAIYKERKDKENALAEEAPEVVSTSATDRTPLSARVDPSQPHAQSQLHLEATDDVEAIPKKQTRSAPKPKAAPKTAAKKRGMEPDVPKSNANVGTSKRARVASGHKGAVEPAKPKRGRARK